MQPPPSARILLALLLCLCFGSWGLTAADRLNVSFAAGVTPLEQTRVLVHDGAETVRKHGRRHSATVLASTDSQAALTAESAVTHVEIDQVVSCGVNPLAAQTQNAGSVGTQSVEYVSYGLMRIDGTPGHGINTGTGVVIAIVDTGINLTHPDLQPNLIGNHNIINPLKTANDDNGHGSHCAGVAAAAHNGVGVIGVAPDAHLLAVKVLDSTGSGYESDVADGIEWAADNGAQVISLSLGGPADSSLQAAVQYAAGKGVVLCCAAGNSGPAAPGSSDVIYPAAYPECIAVSAWCDLDGTSAATGAQDAWGAYDESLAAFSCTGPEVAVTAPGVYIYSDWLTTGKTNGVTNNGYQTESGTSMATPHVAGLAALLIKAGKPDIRAAIAACTEKVAGTHDQVGAGLIRASALPPPTLTITGPADGTTFEYDQQPLTLSATASDLHDGSLNSAVHWSSSLMGALGTGASIAPTLSVGDHTLTASVTDSNGLTASATRVIHIVATPVVIHAINLQLVGATQDLQVQCVIQDDHGAALPGVSAACYTYVNGVYFGGRGGVSGSDGSFSYVQTGVPAGTITVKTVSVTGANTTWDGSSPVASIVKSASTAIVIHALTLQLSGFNKDLQTICTVQNGSGAPLPNANVTCYTYLNGVYWHGHAGTTGADGTLTFVQTGAPAGTYTVKVVSASGPGASWNGLSPVGTLVKPVFQPVVVQSVAMQLVGVNQDLQVTCTVTDDHGVPLANVAITCYIYLNGTYWHGRGGTTGASGIYTFIQTGAPAGNYTAKVISATGATFSWDGSSPVGAITK